MENLDAQLKNLQHKLQLLLKQNQLLLRQNKTLHQEIEALKQTLKDNGDVMQHLRQQVDILKLTGAGLDENEKKLLERKIDGYLAEIEKCITLLNE